ncbi:MAG: hypothetical protein FWG83_03910 [Oscillospiraceae bacterium]|nr:hypothetical protein [Oscillospiraceae bacterium]
MDIQNSAKIVEFMGTYNKHFSEVVDFLNRKQQKVLADDLLWLHESLSEEQRLSMAGLSLENKRLALFDSMGYGETSSKELLELMPEEYKGRFKLECTNMEGAIDRIRSLNADILETIEKKIAVAETFLKEKGVSAPGFYDGSSGKVGKIGKLRLGNPDDNVIGSM